MKKIGLISDTHGYLDYSIFKHLGTCDEIWHAGDFGGSSVASQLQDFKPLRGVYGNIDDSSIREKFPEKQSFICEDLSVLMIHIGGFPGKYAPKVKDLIIKERPRLFVCGHSHILKVIRDDALDCLHINPGAAGRAGWHQIRTIIKFNVDGHHISNCEVIELGPK